MIDEADYEEMAERCLAAHEAVMEHGTEEMQAFTTALLHALAKLAARQIMGKADGDGII